MNTKTENRTGLNALLLANIKPLLALAALAFAIWLPNTHPELATYAFYGSTAIFLILGIYVFAFKLFVDRSSHTSRNALIIALVLCVEIMAGNVIQGIGSNHPSPVFKALMQEKIFSR